MVTAASPTHLTLFSQMVIQLIQEIPPGYVATYGQIAALAGKPTAARRVSWILHSCSQSYQLPWHRIINSKGKISFPWGTKKYQQQKKRLRAEGLNVSEDGLIDLEHYGWEK